MTYDPTRLIDLGRKRIRLKQQLDEVEQDLDPEIRAAVEADVGVQWIADHTGYRRDAVRLKSKSEKERQRLREQRRKVPAKGAT